MNGDWSGITLRGQPVPNLIEAILHKPALKSY